VPPALGLAPALAALAACGLPRRPSSSGAQPRARLTGSDCARVHAGGVARLELLATDALVMVELIV